MASRLSFRPRVPSSALGLTAVVAALCGLAFADTDALLSQGFEIALAKSEAQTLAKLDTSAGSEDFWLRKSAHDGRIVPAAAKPIAVGDRLTISSGGAAQVLEVVEISPLPGGLETVVSVGRSRRLIAVTCQDAVGGRDAPLVHLVLDADSGWPALLGTKAPRAL